MNHYDSVRPSWPAGKRNAMALVVCLFAALVVGEIAAQWFFTGAALEWLQIATGLTLLAAIVFGGLFLIAVLLGALTRTFRRFS